MAQYAQSHSAPSDVDNILSGDDIGIKCGEKAAQGWIQAAEKKPQAKGIIHDLFACVVNKSPCDGQHGINQQDDMQIIKMPLMVEKEQVFEGELDIRPGQRTRVEPRKHKVAGGIGCCPKGKGDKDAEDIVLPQPGDGELFFLGQEQGAAAHEKEGHGTPDKGTPKERPCELRAAYGMGKPAVGCDMNENGAEYSDGFDGVYGYVSCLLVFDGRHSLHPFKTYC